MELRWCLGGRQRLEDLADLILLTQPFDCFVKKVIARLNIMFLGDALRCMSQIVLGIPAKGLMALQNAGRCFSDVFQRLRLLLFQLFRQAIISHTNVVKIGRCSIFTNLSISQGLPICIEQHPLVIAAAIFAQERECRLPEFVIHDRDCRLS